MKTCEWCAYFMPSSAGARDLTGSCRRNPPVPLTLVQQNALGQPVQSINSIFPPVMPAMSCGEWRADDGPRIAQQ